MREEELVKKAEVISAVRDYENKRVRRRERQVDFTVSPSGSDDKILIRVITGSKSRSEYVGVDTVREMSQVLKKRKYDKGILVGKQFTKAAESEMEHENIEAVSEKITPYFKLERLYLVVNDCVDNLCRAKCGLVPVEESDCKGCVNGHYACDVRLISDNASFHFERGWTVFLEKDLTRLLAIEKTLND
ncbi:MAG: restriction endonuclease [Candidatus Bathyarchaeota archaeon]|nr:restriction endonuclease [Candidatus Bathyarchaeota archaeon]MDH5495716.1 restriction endonuclease [Candidatus Bathyarchaeota archaeon]